MNARKNTQVSKRKGQEVLRRWSRRESSRESSREPPQHLSATKRSRSVTIKKRLAPPELATLINLINQVPDGLPSLRELRQTARGIDDPSRAQLYYRYNYMVEGRLALCVIADTDSEYIGPFYLEHHLDEDSEG